MPQSHAFFDAFPKKKCQIFLRQAKILIEQFYNLFTFSAFAPQNRTFLVCNFRALKILKIVKKNAAKRQAFFLRRIANPMTRSVFIFWYTWVFVPPIFESVPQFQEVVVHGVYILYTVYHDFWLQFVHSPAKNISQECTTISLVYQKKPACH